MFGVALVQIQGLVSSWYHLQYHQFSKACRQLQLLFWMFAALLHTSPRPAQSKVPSSALITATYVPANVSIFCLLTQFLCIFFLFCKTTNTQAKERHFRFLAINWWKSFERWEVVSGIETYPKLLHVSDFSRIAINTKHGVLTICMLQIYQRIVAY